MISTKKYIYKKVGGLGFNPQDAEFLRASEGLGNSQKAEAAWLERMGYPYTEVEVRA